MKITSIDELLNNQLEKKQARTLAVVEAADKGVIEAVEKARIAGVINPILIGNKSSILEILAELNYDVANYRIEDQPSPSESTFKAIELVKSEEADFIMKGFLQTSDLLRAIFNKERGFEKLNLLSLLMLMEIPGYHKIIGITDVGINPVPNLEQKRFITENAVTSFKNLGYDKPKVAALSFVETVNPKVAETVDARALQDDLELQKKLNFEVEGPLSFDIAMNAKRASLKGHVGNVAGNPDILLMPNLSSANILAKALGQFVPNTKSVAFVVGAPCPIVLTSRATDAEGKYRSIVAAAAACK